MSLGAKVAHRSTHPYCIPAHRPWRRSTY